MSEAQAHGHEQKHPYHLVDPSPWPVVGAACAGLLALGAAWAAYPGAGVRALG